MFRLEINTCKMNNALMIPLSAPIILNTGIGSSSTKRTKLKEQKPTSTEQSTIHTKENTSGP